MRPHTCKCATCKVRGVILPGWLCSCGAFNGESKAKSDQCRICGKCEKEREEKIEQRNARIVFLHETEKLTFSELAVRFGLSPTRVSRIVRRVIDQRPSHSKKQPASS